MVSTATYSLILDQITVLLERLHIYGFPGAIVGGGAIRDMMLSRSVKDIDVFIPCQPVGVANTAEALTAALGRVVSVSPWCGYIDLADCSTVYEVGHEPVLMSELPVQIMELRPGLPTKERVSRFDFGLCQAWFDGTTWGLTEQFRRDAYDQTMTLSFCESEKEFERSMRRFDRLSKKFPEYELVIPAEFMGLVSKTAGAVH